MIISFVTTAEIVAYVEGRLDEDDMEDVAQVIREDPKAQRVAEHAYRNLQKRDERNAMNSVRADSDT